MPVLTARPSVTPLLRVFFFILANGNPWSEIYCNSLYNSLCHVIQVVRHHYEQNRVMPFSPNSELQMSYSTWAKSTCIKIKKCVKYNSSLFIYRTVLSSQIRILYLAYKNAILNSYEVKYCNYCPFCLQT